MKVYTKTGDMGTTSLVGGARTSKDDPRVEAYGTVDELMANIALLRDNMDSQTGDLEEYRDDLREILSQLMRAAALLATDKESKYRVAEMKDQAIDFLEKRIDYITTQLQPLGKFTIPGGHPMVSMSHICRTVCRRAERRCVTAASEHEVSPQVMRYLNRLSDYLYVLGRRLSDEFGAEEAVWVPED